jgi:predicted nicotinamide N-methyase
MPGYMTKQESIAIAGTGDIVIRSLLDRLQFADPGGVAERLGIGEAQWSLFGLLWPSGAQLAARLALRATTSGETILEIGCGLGLASLVGHRNGADITASDRHPLAAAFLLENVRLNHLLPLKYRHGQWGEPHADADPIADADRVRGRFDLIIGSDLLYERDAGSILAGFIGRHAAAAGEVWIVDPDRGNRPAFHRAMARHGFAMREERIDVRAGIGIAAYKGRLLTYRREPGFDSSAPDRNTVSSAPHRLAPT